MVPADPRDRYDDLVASHVEEAVDAETFAEKREMEAFRSGWVAVGYVFDDEGRLLLIHEEPADDDPGQWIAPGGTLQPGESLAEGLVRELREETGVEVSPVRPRSVADVVVHDGTATSKNEVRTSFTVVGYEATAETTDVGEDLGVDDEEIVDADWFDKLPENVFDREAVEEILDECERWEW